MDTEWEENLSTRMRSDRLVTIKGTIRPTEPSSAYYDHVNFVPKARLPATPEALVEAWLDDDEDDPCPEDLRLEWLGYATDFLSSVTYSTHEHMVLLTLSFTRYLQRIGRL